MQKDARSISLDVCDYTGTPVCNLYDNSNDMPGQAVNVFVHIERNGYKELRFDLPSMISNEEENYRCNYLISDYRIRFSELVKEKQEIDWYLISESKIQHDNLSKNWNIRASHISQLLKTKNLELEFSDSDGNNVGTIGQIASTILEGTGWHLGDVRSFCEEVKYGYDENTEKIRSFSASSKTGAFKMMNDLCEMFDAKPLYHGEGSYTAYIVSGINPQGISAEYGRNYDKYESDRAAATAEDIGWTNVVITQQPNPVVGRTVDILPINPFSKDLTEGTVPKEVLEGENVLELYYDRNIKNITRTLNTDAIVTKMSGYGSYGSLSGGICTLQTATHSVFYFDETIMPGEYYFEYKDAAYYFTATTTANNLKWSTLDFTSRSYVYDGENCLFKVYDEAKTNNSTLIVGREETEQNYVPYLMDFTYYDSIGLLSDEMLLALARHQTTIVDKYIAATDASTALSIVKDELTRTASAGNGFLMLDISGSEVINNQSDVNYGNVRLTINKQTYKDGVIYRSDYEESPRSYFSWNCASGIKTDGTAINATGAVVYIVRQGNPTVWQKTYIKSLGTTTDNFYQDLYGNKYTLHEKESYSTKDAFPSTGTYNLIYQAEDTKKLYIWFSEKYVDLYPSNYIYGLNMDEPQTITLWTSQNYWHQGDKVYLFSADCIAGVFGPKEDSVYSNRKSVEETIKGVTQVHPVVFITDSESAPLPSICYGSYGWYYHSFSDTFNFGDLYFCWADHGDNGWHKVYVSNANVNPEKEDARTVQEDYYYSTRFSQMYYKTSSTKWTALDEKDTDQGRLKTNFATVVCQCKKQEYLIKGLKEQYTHTATKKLNANYNYAFRNEFDYYWLFTLTQDVNIGQTIRYDISERKMWQDDNVDHVIIPVERSFNSIEYANIDELFNNTYIKTDYDNGQFTQGDTYYTNQAAILAYPGVSYEFNLPANSKVVCLNANSKWISDMLSSPFTSPTGTNYLKVVCPTEPTSSHWLRMKNYSNTIIVEREKVYELISCSSSGERSGLYYLMDKFIDLASDAYQVKLPALKEAQQAIVRANTDLANLLGDMYREGSWQENSYVEDDIPKLYADTLDNLKEMSHPQATYDFTFLDLYGSQPVTEDCEDTEWPDIEITYAAHLVDPEIDINKWAYIDKIDKCYDQPWKTQIEINTRLSMIGQQSFTDVLTKIAEVANETKAKQTIYQRAAALTSSGKLAASNLEDALQMYRCSILGGTSNWYTDNKGNIIFEDVGDPEPISAMMLTGRGLLIASSKDEYGEWNWRTAITGQGIAADAIATGEMSAIHILAGSITTDKLSSTVGNELEIGSNKALALYATIDGNRPAGSLITSHPGEGDSWIAIQAKNGNQPAAIAVKSGGKIIIEGGELDLTSNSTIKLEAGTNMDLNASGNLNLTATQGTVNITSGGSFLVDSSNFKITKTGNTYNVKIVGSGEIAGFKIGQRTVSSAVIDYLYSGQHDNIDAVNDGVYIGTDGVNIGGNLIFKSNSNGQGSAILKVNAANVSLGDITGFSTLKGKLENMDNKTETAQQTADGKSRTYHCNKDTILTKKDFVVGDIWQDSSSAYGYEYVCKKKYDSSYSANTFDNYWTLIGTSITGGAAFSLDAASGEINIVAGKSMSFVSGGTISIAANKKITLTTLGTIEIGNGVKPFTIGATTGTNGHAYMYNGKTSLTDTTNDGAYYGTDGFIIGKGNGNYVKATASGDISITGSITASALTLLSGVTVPHEKVSGLDNAGVAYSYQVSTSGTTIPTGTWSTTRPTSIDKGKYLWTKIATTNLTGVTTYAYNVEYYPNDGSKGDKGDDGIYVSSILPLYNLNTSKPSIDSSTTIYDTDVSKKWTTICPTYITDYTYYRSEKYTYSDNSIKFAAVYADYGLSVSNKEAKSAASTVEPFTHDGLSYGQTWGGVNYGVVLSSSSSAKPLLIGSNAGITIAKSATNSDGAAVVINKDGIKMHATAFTLTTTASTAGSQTNAFTLDSTGIHIYTGAAFTVQTGKFNISANGDVYMKGEVEATTGKIADWFIKSGYIGSASTAAASKTGIGTGTGDSNYVFWAGNTQSDQSKSKFYIKADGSGLVGGWNVAANKLYNVDNSVGIANGTDTNGVVFWAGGTTPTSAPFHVGNNGFFTSTHGNIGGWTITAHNLTNNQGATGIGDGATSGAVFWSGNADPLQANFLVGTTGWMKAMSAEIGGWQVRNVEESTNVYTRRIYSGSNTNYVALDSGSTNVNHAIWVGQETSSDNSPAPFAVARDGKVYLTKLMMLKDNGDGTTTSEEVNLTSNNSRLRGGTVVGWTTDSSGNCTQLKTTYGNVNFNPASSVQVRATNISNIVINGNTYTVYGRITLSNGYDTGTGYLLGTYTR